MNAATTVTTGFGYIPIIKQDLFEVRAGVEQQYALTEAICLAESIERLSNEAVNNGEMDASMAYIVNFATRAIQGLLHSIDRA